MAKAATAQKSTKNQKIVNETSNFLLIDSKNDVSFHTISEWLEMAEDSYVEQSLVLVKLHSSKVTAEFISDTSVIVYSGDDDEVKVKMDSSISFKTKNLGKIRVNGSNVHFSSKNFESLIVLLTGFMCFNHRGSLIQDCQHLNDSELLLVFNH